jgi:hypothetical protein
VRKRLVSEKIDLRMTGTVDTIPSSSFDLFHFAGLGDALVPGKVWAYAIKLCVLGSPALQRRLGHGDCGIYAEVIAGGSIAVGDAIVAEEQELLSRHLRWLGDFRRHPPPPSRHCEERQRRSNPFFSKPRHGLLRFARNDGEHKFAISRRNAPE